MNTIEFIPILGKNHEGKKVRGICVPSKYLFQFGKEIKNLQYKNEDEEYYSIYDTLIYNFDYPYSYFLIDYLVNENYIQIVVTDEYIDLEEYSEGIKLTPQVSTVQDMLEWLNCGKGALKYNI